MRVIGTDRRKPHALRHQGAGIGYHARHHRLDIGTVVADESDDGSAWTGNVGERIGLAIGGWKAKIERLSGGTCGGGGFGFSFHGSLPNDASDGTDDVKRRRPGRRMTGRRPRSGRDQPALAK